MPGLEMLLTWLGHTGSWATQFDFVDNTLKK